MPLDYLGYVTRLHKLDTVRVANQRKNSRAGLRSTPSLRNNFGSPSQLSTPISEVPITHPSNPFSYQPSIAATTTATTPFISSSAL